MTEETRWKGGGNEFIKQMTLMLQHGDALAQKKRYHEAIEAFEAIISAFRDVETNSEMATFAASQESSSLWTIVVHFHIIVPLDHLADACQATGDTGRALECREEVVMRLEAALALAGDDARPRLEKMLPTALRKLEQTRAVAGPVFWVGYRGDDTGRQIRVHRTEAATGDRLRTLLLMAARHHRGQVTSVFQADTEAEALRMASYQF
jgi:hypothetical protein